MSEPKTEYLVGHVIDVLRSLPEKSVQCAVTSSPYYGLRKYSGAQDVVWGGRTDCDHAWGEAGGGLQHENRNFCNGTQDEVEASGKPKVAVRKARTVDSSRCSKCGAWRGCLGLEDSPEQYVRNLVLVFREVRRVLRDDGTVWLNLGDSYAGSGKAGKNPEYWKKHTEFGKPSEHEERFGLSGVVPSGLKPLDLMGVPWRVALSLQADGWYLRSDNIWTKESCLPESQDGWKWERHRIHVKNRTRGSQEEWCPPDSHHPGQVPHRDGAFSNSCDSEWAPCPGCPKCTPNGGYILRRGSWRPTKAHEYIFMLTKTDEYFGDSDAVRNPFADKRMGRDGSTKPRERNRGGRTDGFTKPNGIDPSGNCGRNLRSVLKFKMTPFKGSHYATFPLGIPTLAIKASTSEGGACPTCGAPYARVLNIVRPNWKDEGLTTEHEVGQRKIAMELYGETGNQKTRSIADIFGRATRSGRETLGWKATCACEVNGPPVPQTVLDPFVGAGTTLIAAMELGRNAIGIDISEDYKKLAERRIEEWKAKKLAPKRQARPKKPKIIALQKKLEDVRPEAEQATFKEE